MKKILTGLAVGSVVGSAVALLFAPKKGKELREDITVQYDKAKETSKETVEKAKNRIAKIRYAKVKEATQNEEVVAETTEEVKAEAVKVEQPKAETKADTKKELVKA